MDSTRPRALADPTVVAQRMELWESDETLEPLRAYAAELAERRNAVVPLFDPSEGGVTARVMFLLEAPGPMTNADNARPGSGFISVDNNDQTAENTWRARTNAGLLTGVLAWNIVPWYLGPASIHPNAAQVGQGAMELRRLLPLLPELRVVLLAGRIAQAGWHKHVAPHVGGDLAVIETWHPSPLALNQQSRRDDFARAVERAASYA